VRATAVSTVPDRVGEPGSGPLTTPGQPSWEMKTIKPRPTAPTRASRANEARRMRRSMLPSARLRPPSDREKACPSLETTFTSIGARR
jgi:hypothetical protein